MNEPNKAYQVRELLNMLPINVISTLDPNKFKDDHDVKSGILAIVEELETERDRCSEALKDMPEIILRQEHALTILRQALEEIDKAALHIKIHDHAWTKQSCNHLCIQVLKNLGKEILNITQSALQRVNKTEEK